MLLLNIFMKMQRQKKKKMINGEKEVVEVSPAKDKVKINKRPVSIKRYQSALDETSK